MTTTIPAIEPFEAVFTRDVAQRAIDAKTKPLGALGRLEDIAVRLAVLQRTLAPSVDRARVCVFGADHGVTDEGVSAYPRVVTAEMMRNFGRGGAAINVIARTAAVDVEVVDVGVDADLSTLHRVVQAKVRRGSRNFVHEAAMTPTELDAALAVGADAVRRAVDAGMQALGLGEMGIGNTTSAAALLSGLTGESALVTVGLGTGVSDETLARKRAAVDRAVALHSSAIREGGPRECLRRLGGLELAAIAGATVEAGRHRVAIIADGFISTVAILCAVMATDDDESLRASLRDAVFFAHRSSEQAHGLALDACAVALGTSAQPLLSLGMRLGEGTGAALAVPVLRSAAAVMRDMATFESAGVSAGEHADDHAAPPAPPHATTGARPAGSPAVSRQGVAGQLRAAAAALTFLTRIPASRFAPHDADDLPASVVYFPVVGLIVGLAGAAAFGIAVSFWPPVLAAIVSTALTVWLTGAFHEDALADALDGFGGGREPARILAIMKDSRVGSYALVGVLLVIAAKIAALVAVFDATASAKSVARALIAAHVLGRWSSVVLLARYPYVRGAADGSGDRAGTGRPFVGGVTRSRLAIATVLALVIAGIAVRSRIIIVAIATVAVVWLAGRYFARRIGGVTGDAIGAANQLVELAVYLAIAAQ